MVIDTRDHTISGESRVTITTTTYPRTAQVPATGERLESNLYLYAESGQAVDSSGATVDFGFCWDPF